MKILDRYILTSYLKTFFSVLIILILIFVLQSIWLYIRELSGKDLDLIVILKFLIYVTPKLIPLVLPLTILLSSIMVFGNFAENYEFAAMKSTGISLQRAMSGLSIFIVILGITTFFFANNVIPWAEYNFLNLRVNIKNTKPAMAIAEGQFNPIGDFFNIKVKEKSGDKGQYLKDVMIHVKAPDKRTNSKTIVAKTGELSSEKDSNILQLILYDGNYYEDIISKTSKNKSKKPFAKSKFEKYIMNIDLSGFNNVDFDEKTQSDKYSMLGVNDLRTTIDSLIIKQEDKQLTFSKNLYQKANAPNRIVEIKESEMINDSIYKTSLLNILDTKEINRILRTAVSTTKNTKKVLEDNKASYKKSKSNFNKHIISLNEKFSLGFACIILFFVGAPLGAIIRKGGIGLPMVIAILLFLTYHFIGIFATNSAKNGEFNPMLATWFSTLIMLPLSIYLTKRATADRGLFEIGNLLDPLKKVFNINSKNDVDYTFLSSKKNDELLNIISNYNTLGHPESYRYASLNLLLLERGETINSLRGLGIDISQDYTISNRIVNNYKVHSKFAIVLYAIGTSLLILFFIFRNNKLPSLASASIQLSIISLVLYVIYYLKSILNLNQFYKHIKKLEKFPNIILLIVGLPFYMTTYPLLDVKIKEDLQQNCLESLK